MPYDHVVGSATFADKLFTARQAMVIDSVEYINPTGVATDAVNFWIIGIKAGTTVVAQWSCETGEEGVIAANTIVDMVISDDPDMRAAADDVISFFGTKAAAAVNIPAGRLVIHAHYI